jgi:hypothetical protein
MANSTKKMTKKDYFAILKATYPTDAKDYDEVIAFIDHEIELLSRKNSAEKKPTATQTANEGLKKAILETMEPSRLYTITDLIKEVPALAEMTNQKVSAIVRQMLGTDIERVEEKRKAYFRLITE